MEDRVFARFPSDVMDALQFLVDRGDFPSMSSAVIYAVESLIRERLSEEELAVSKDCRELEVLDLQDSLLEESIRSAVHNHVGVDGHE